MKTETITKDNVAELTGDYERDGTSLFTFIVNVTLFAVWIASLLICSLGHSKINLVIMIASSLFVFIFYFLGLNKFIFSLIGRKSKKRWINFINFNIAYLKRQELKLKEDSESMIRERIQKETSEEMAETYRKFLLIALQTRQSYARPEFIDYDTAKKAERKVEEKVKAMFEENVAQIIELNSEMVRLRELILEIQTKK